MGRWAFVATSVLIAGCSLFTDLGGLDDPAPTTIFVEADAATNDGATPGDATPGGELDAGEDAKPSAAKYARTVTVTNTAPDVVPAGNSVCTVLGSDVAATAVKAGRMRSDFNDARVFSPAGVEVARTVDALADGRASLCFRLEQAIASGSGATYELRYGDPNATPGPSVGVFAFLEEFDSPPGSPRWSTRGNPTVANGRLKLPAGTVSSIATSPGTDGVPVTASVTFSVQITNPTSPPITKDAGNAEDDFYWWFGFQRYGDFAEGEPWMVFIGREVGGIRAENKQQTSATGPCAAAICFDSTYGLDDQRHIYRVDRYLAGVSFTYDDGKTYAPLGSAGDMAILIRNSLAASDMFVDWVRARPMVWPEPTIVVSAEKTL